MRSPFLTGRCAFIKIKAPKIKIGDPTKLITKPLEGVTNALGSMASTNVKAVADVAGNAVAGVGQVMSQPGAGAALGIAGTAFGIPGLGALGGLFGNSSTGTAAPAPAPVSTPQVITLPAESKDNSMVMIIAAVGIGLALTIAIIFGLKKR